MSLPICGWKNVPNTQDEKCKCGSWKSHWENTTKKEWPEQCCVEDCEESAADGAHVQHNEVTGEKIVPMCAAHNNASNKDEMCFKDGTVCCSAEY